MAVRTNKNRFYFTLIDDVSISVSYENIFVSSENINRYPLSKNRYYHSKNINPLKTNTNAFDKPKSNKKTNKTHFKKV